MPSAADSPVLILTGPPGVGKTTAAAILTTQVSPAVHLEADTFFRFISSGYVDPREPESREQNEVVMGIVAATAASYAAAGYFTVVDGIVIPRWFLAPLRDGLRGAGLEAAYAVARAPLEVCLERLRQREGIDADLEAMERMWEEFADLGEHEGHAVDVTGMSPDEAAAEIAGRLDAGRLTL
ncbi:MAG TPA: AAA family ATPase [Solirubrobacterales bacterium]|nr:AAA family ATPase [Solirubrobacterales bacterium]